MCNITRLGVAKPTPRETSGERILHEVTFVGHSLNRQQDQESAEQQGGQAWKPGSTQGQCLPAQHRTPQFYRSMFLKASTLWAFPGTCDSFLTIMGLMAQRSVTAGSQSVWSKGEYAVDCICIGLLWPPESGKTSEICFRSISSGRSLAPCCSHLNYIVVRSSVRVEIIFARPNICI